MGGRGHEVPTHPRKLEYISSRTVDISISNGQWLESMSRQMNHTEKVASLSPGKGFKALLRPYQPQGLSWLNFLARNRFGACLADDMGLGKTVQILALLSTRPGFLQSKPKDLNPEQQDLDRLDLTRAGHVIYFDRWWNPAVENQATDRTFRIGQTRKLLVHVFVTRGTIEEKIDKMLQEKQNLADQLVAPSGEHLLTQMEDDQLLDFFKFSDTLNINDIPYFTENMSLLLKNGTRQKKNLKRKTRKFSR